MRKNNSLIIVVLILALAGFVYLFGANFSKLNPLAATGLFSSAKDKENETALLLDKTKAESAKLQEEINLKKEKLETEKELRVELELRYRSEIAVLAGELETLTQMVDDFNRQVAQLTIASDTELEIVERSCFINLNTASLEDLQKLTGIGLVLAQRIIDARPFSSVYDLIKVSGIGGTILQKIIEQGCAYVDEIGEREEEEEIFEEGEELEEAADICPININTASKEELQVIIGIGPVLAQRITEARPFYSLSDLIRVSGIGQTTLDKIIAQKCAFASGYTGGGSGTSSAPPPPPLAKPRSEMSLVYPEENPINKEIEVIFSALNLKDASYDVKISIEKDRVLSQIYNEKKEGEDKWQSSAYYLGEVFAGTSFEGNFRLKIREDKDDFRGKAEIIARIRETGKTGFSEFKGIINIADREEKPVVEYNLIIDIIGEGTTDPVVGTHVYEENEEVIVTAFPDAGWEFIRWEAGSVMADEAAITIIMDEDKTITAIFEEEQDESESPINLLLNEFFEEWEEPANSANHLYNWEYNGTAGHIAREGNGLVKNYSARWAPITAAYNLTQASINISEAGIYYAEAWIKPLNVDVDNYVRIALDVADPVTGNFTTASFTDYKDEGGWIKLTKTREIEAGENGGIRIRAQRSTAVTDPFFLIGAAWLGISPPPKDWLDKI